MPKKRVLFLAAEPTNENRLLVGKELREIQVALQMSSRRASIELIDRFAARPGDLTQALHDVRPHIVHFSGHGAKTGSLCFEDELGKSKNVTPEALAGLFALVADHVECVVLNACYSATQADGIAKSIDYVLGMEEAVGDAAAILFSSGFYKALGASRSYPDAFNFGVAEMQIGNALFQGVPKLHKRHGTGPRSFTSDAPRPPAGHASFSFRPGGSVSEYIHVDVSQFSTVAELLDEIFLSHLSDLVTAYSYGSEWVIVSGRRKDRIVATPLWVLPTAVDRPMGEIAPGWHQGLGLDEVGIAPHTSHEILFRTDVGAPLAQHAYAVLLEDGNLYDRLLNNPKERSRLRDLLKSIDHVSVESMVNRYQHRLVFRDRWNLGFAGSVFADEGVGTPVV